MSTQEMNRCPVCGKSWLGYMDICPVCEWQNDMVQLNHPDWEGCANKMSLNQAREAYQKEEQIK
jgi:hypothetical protein